MTRFGRRVKKKTQHGYVCGGFFVVFLWMGGVARYGYDGSVMQGVSLCAAPLLFGIGFEARDY